MQENSMINKNKNLTETLILFIFSIAAFFSSYSASTLLGLVTILISCYIAFNNQNIFLGIIFSIAALAHFFSISIFGYEITLNSLFTILFILINSMKISITKTERNAKILFSVYILLGVSVTSLIKIPEIVQTTWILNIMFFITLYFRKNKNFNWNSVIKGISITGLTWTILIFYFIYTNPYYININSQRATLVNDLNPNRLGMSMVIYGVIAFVVFYQQESKIKKLLSLITYAFSIYVIFHTGSRNSLLAIILCSSLILFEQVKQKGKFIKNLVAITSVLFLLVYVYSLFKDTNLISRFAIDSIISDRGSGRFNSFPILIKEILPRNIFFGVGLGGQEKALVLMGYSNYPPAHNMIISSLVEIGIIGFIPLLYLTSVAMRIINSKFNNHRMYKIVKYSFISVLLLGIGETIFSERIFWVIISIIFAISRFSPINLSVPINENY